MNAATSREKPVDAPDGPDAPSDDDDRPEASIRVVAARDDAFGNPSEYVTVKSLKAAAHWCADLWKDGRR